MHLLHCAVPVVVMILLTTDLLFDSTHLLHCAVLVNSCRSSLEFVSRLCTCCTVLKNGLCLILLLLLLVRRLVT